MAKIILSVITFCMVTLSLNAGDIIIEEKDGSINLSNGHVALKIDSRTGEMRQLAEHEHQ